MKKPLIIGIAGGSASGKTSISRRISETFNDFKSVQVLKQDDYYKSQDDMAMSERLKTNYDHPFAFDNDYLICHLKELIEWHSIEKPMYDFVNHTRSKNKEHIEPAEVLILEGLFVLEEPKIREICDIKIFVDTDADVRFIRRMLRDVNERGRSLENVVNQYQKTVKIMHEQFVEPSKKYADVIIPVGGENDVAIDLLVTKIGSILKL